MQNFVLHDNNKRVANRCVWKLNDYTMFFYDIKPSFEVQTVDTPIQPNG